MKKEEFYFDSNDGLTKIRTLIFKPEGEVKAVLQIAHGMVEFIDRYEGFAKYLCDRGYLVVGNDHLGHGESVNDKKDWGYFAKENGYQIVLKDLYKLMNIIKEQYPDKKYFLLGHSMGSFFARLFIIEYGKELDGAIIMGTGQQNKTTLVMGKALIKIIQLFKGDRYRSKFINNMALGAYNKEYEPSKTHCDWLTKDKNIVIAYSKEPKNCFTFTLNGYYNLFSLIERIIDPKDMARMPKDLRVLIVSGEDDPVGNKGKDPKTVYDLFKQVSMNNVDLKLYPNDRHEILNELDKETVYEDLYNWLESK